MSERLFLLELKMELRELPEDEIEKIISEYRTYFLEATNEGLTEKEVIDRLGGSPKVLADSIIEKERLKKDTYNNSQSSVRSIFIVIGLILFNLIIVIGPFIAFLGMAVALLALFGVSLISPFIVLFDFAIQGGHLFELMSSFVFFGAALLVYPAVKKGVDVVIKSIKTYVLWNKRVIREGRL